MAQRTVRPMNRRAGVQWAIAGALVTGSVLAGCANDSRDTPSNPASPTSSSIAAPLGGPIVARPAAPRTTCPEATIAPLPANLTLTNRELVPFSSDRMGVDALYEDSEESRSLQLVSGGYADEITESYDNLVSAPSVHIDGIEAAVLKGSLLNDSVTLVFWQMQAVQVPCDLHVLIATNVPDAEFASLVPLITAART